MAETERNPHAGRPFRDDDATIAAALEALSVPALLCSLVHITGDPSWIRGDLRPQASALNDYQGSMSPEDMAEARRLALPAIVAGIRIATVTTIGLITVTALIGQGGLGQFMIDGFQRDFRTPLTVGIVLSVALAVAADLILVGTQRLLSPWARAKVKRENP